MSILLVTERFAKLASTTIAGLGMASAPMVVLPPSELTEYGTRSEQEAIAEQALDQAIQKMLARVKAS